MPVETDISREKAFFYEERAKKVINGLKKRGMNGQYVPRKPECLRFWVLLWPEGLLSL